MPTPTTARAILTGFPGYLAWRVCALLLRARPGLAIDALIAPRDRDRAATAARELDHLVPGAAARLRWHPYRPDAPDLGLDPALAATLAATVTEICHLAGVGEPCRPARAADTAGLLAFAARCAARPRFNHLSTAFVSGDRVGLIAEEDFAAGQGFRNAWEEAAYATERRVRAARPDLPIAIYRPTFIVGDSRTGEIGQFGGAYAILRLLDHLDAARIPPPMIGRGAAPAHLIPIDYVAAAIAHLAADPAAVGRTFHLADPDSPTIWAAYARCAALLIGRAPRWGVTPGLAARALRSRALRRLAIPPAIAPYFDGHATYGTAQSHALLAPRGLTPPSFGDYAPAVVDFYADRCDDPRFAPTLA